MSHNNDYEFAASWSKYCACFGFNFFKLIDTVAIINYIFWKGATKYSI